MIIKKLSADIIAATKELRILGQGKLNGLVKEIGYRECPQIIFGDMPKDDMNGYYSPTTNMIVLRESLLDVHEYMVNVFLHELAHFVDFVVNGDSGHDRTFKDICLLLGVDENFTGARTKTGMDSYRARQEKVRKLLNLGTSSFQEEAESAMLKARQLMEKWDIRLPDDEESIYCAQIPIKRREAWIGWLGYAVSLITGAFPLFCRENFEYYGTREQVEAALYIHDSLLQSIDVRCEKIIRDIKNPPKAPFVSKNVQGTFEEYLVFLSHESAMASTGTERINRAQIRAGIVNGFLKKLQENESREIALRIDTNKKLMVRITDIRLFKRARHVSKSKGYLQGLREGKTISVEKNGTTKRIGAS